LLEFADKHVPLVVSSANRWQAASLVLLSLSLLDDVFAQSHLQVIFKHDSVCRSHGRFDSLERVALNVKTDKLLEK